MSDEPILLWLVIYPEYVAKKEKENEAIMRAVQGYVLLWKLWVDLYPMCEIRHTWLMLFYKCRNY